APLINFLRFQGESAKSAASPVTGSALQDAAARIFRRLAKLLLDADQLVIFREPVGTAEAAGLDLAAVGGNRKIGDRRILGLARAVRHYGGVARLMRHLDRFQRLRQRADLVDLDENGVGNAALDPIAKALRVGDEKIVADKLHPSPDFLGQQLPALPVILAHPILNRDDRIIADESGVVLDHRAGLENFALALQMVFAILEEFGRGCIEREIDILTRLVAGA